MSSLKPPPPPPAPPALILPDAAAPELPPPPPIRYILLLELFQSAGVVNEVPDVSKYAEVVAPDAKAIPVLLLVLVELAPAQNVMGVIFDELISLIER